MFSPYSGPDVPTRQNFREMSPGNVIELPSGSARMGERVLQSLKYNSQETKWHTSVL